MPTDMHICQCTQQRLLSWPGCLVKMLTDSQQSMEEEATLKLQYCIDCTGLAAAEAGEEQWQWLLTVMALSVLHKGLRKGKLREQLPEQLAMLDGILPLLAAALKSRQPPVASLALRCLAILLTLPLPGALPPQAPAGCHSQQLPWAIAADPMPTL